MGDVAWLVACARKMTIVAVANLANAQRRTAKTEAALWRRTSKHVFAARKPAGRDCCKRSSLMGSQNLPDAMAKNVYWIVWNAMNDRAWYITVPESMETMMIFKK